MQNSTAPKAEEVGAGKVVMGDSDVVGDFLSGNERAFDELVVRYQTRLRNFIYRTIGDRERAEDLVQDTFLRVYRHAPNFDHSKKFSTWVYTIASNLVKNELRNRSRDVISLFRVMLRNSGEDDGEPQFEDTKYCPDEMFRHRQLLELVEQTIAALPPNHRQVFTLFEREGKSYEEIAEITNCNLGTVKSRLFRARTAFATIIEPALN